MTTKKRLRAEIAKLESDCRAKCAEADSIINRQRNELSEAEKLTAHQRETIRVLNTRLDEVEDSLRKREEFIVEIEDSLSCARCAYLDENGKKLRPQKCACCRRGAKDNYMPMEATEA